MSRLLGRIRQLERRFGDCPTCQGRTVLSELVGPNGPRPTSNTQDRSPCPDCGQPRKVIRIILAFDPYEADPDDDASDSSPRSADREREQEANQ